MGSSSVADTRALCIESFDVQDCAPLLSGRPHYFVSRSVGRSEECMKIVLDRIG
jgi:hypothetical protein